MRSVWRVAKDEAVAERGMVAAKHPLAVEAGLAALKRGGNAVDAAVTTAFTLGVVEPGASGLGGGGMMIVHQAATGRNVVVDFAMDAPLAATADSYELERGAGSSRFGWRKVKDDANVSGYRAVAVPGLVRGLALALERFGTVSLSEALGPAIRFAEEGFVPAWTTSLQIAVSMPILSQFPASAAVFLPGGFPPRPLDGNNPGARLIQPDLARTLRAIAREGPDAFYRGPIARSIGEAMRQHGGLVSEEDLAAYRAMLVDGGLATDYRGHQVVGVPGACGAVTALQSLNILEGFDLARSGAGTPESVHRQAEAFRRAFADRYRYVGDPKQAAVPWSGLLSKAYARALRDRIDPERAAAVVDPGDPWAFESGRLASEAPVAGVFGASGDRSTTHVCAVDGERNVVSLTQTLVNLFGSGVIVPGTGVLLNNAMLWFDPEHGRPNSLEPGKRGLNNMTPLLLLRDGRPFLALGAPGGLRIVNAMAQVVVNVVDYRMGIQDAIAAPRIDCSGRDLLVDARFPDSVPRAMEAMGHRLRVVEESFYGANFSTPLGILIHPETGRLHGGVDPFRPAIAAGY